jgi:rhodanese-related sulfurtransferase/rubrerythrin
VKEENGMRWKQFVTPAKSMNSKQLKDFISTHDEGKFLILDVRQPHEYEKEHIPGAKLIPLPELLEHLEELDPVKPTIAYCAVGGRSRAASQLLSSKGFRDVSNLEGGIASWLGRKAIGPVETQAVVFDEKAPPEEIIPLAYGLEEGLRRFYTWLSSEMKDKNLASLFIKLASIENIHKQKLFALYANCDKAHMDVKSFEKNIVSNIMEGGFTNEEFIQKNRPAMETVQDIIDLAMTIETQALDLYMRLADKAESEESKNIFFRIAEDEKAHLKSLGKLSTPSSAETQAF